MGLNNEFYKNYIKNYNDYLKSNQNGNNSISLLIKENQYIITFCKEIDEMLNGGIPLGKLTEFFGVPGIGKTQIAFQLLVNVSIPRSLGGVEGKAIYIDTEGNYSCSRVREIAKHLSEHLEKVNSPSSTNTNATTTEPFELTEDQILNNIYFYRVFHYIELLSLVHQLPLFLEKNKDVRLIILDSITFPFRNDFTDLALRTRVVLSLAQSLMNIANRFNVAVVFMNQVTTKISHNKESILVPYLGESWAHICTYRMVLFWKLQQRFCHLLKSPSSKSCYYPFFISELGIRGLNNEEEDNNNNTDEEDNVEYDQYLDPDDQNMMAIEYK